MSEETKNWTPYIYEKDGVLCREFRMTDEKRRKWYPVYEPIELIEANIKSQWQLLYAATKGIGGMKNLLIVKELEIFKTQLVDKYAEILGINKKNASERTIDFYDERFIYPQRSLTIEEFLGGQPAEMLLYCDVNLALGKELLCGIFDCTTLEQIENKAAAAANFEFEGYPCTRDETLIIMNLPITANEATIDSFFNAFGQRARIYVSGICGDGQPERRQIGRDKSFSFKTIAQFKQWLTLSEENRYVKQRDDSPLSWRFRN